MKITVKLFFCFFYIIKTYAMEETRTWIRTKDKKKFAMNECDKNHTLLINIRKKNALYSGSFKNYPLGIDLKKKDLKFFVKIIHQPALYHTFKLKKCYKALQIAEKLKAPLLYAELLHAKLPPTITALINQKYISLYNIKSTLYHELRHIAELNLINQSNNINFSFFSQDFDSYMENLPQQIHNFITPFTLPQTVLFTLFYYEKYCIKIQPHTIGYQPSHAFTQDQLDLLYTLCNPENFTV